VAIAESAPGAETRSVCVIRIRTTVGQHFNITDTEHRAGLSAIAELLACYV